MNQSYREGLKGGLIRNDAGEEDYLSFQNRCVRKFGPAAGIFVRQLVYWTGRQHDPKGWIYKTQSEMEQETGLSRRHQERARKVLLSQGVIKEDKRGIPRKLWYWIDFAALVRIMEDPHSTLNQRARKQENNAAETMNIGEGVSQDSISEHTDEIANTAQASWKGSTHPACEFDSSALASENDTTDRPITEGTAQTTAGITTNNHSSENQLLQSCEDRASGGLSQHEGARIAESANQSLDNNVLTRIYHLWTTPDTKGSSPEVSVISSKSKLALIAARESPPLSLALPGAAPLAAPSPGSACP